MKASALKRKANANLSRTADDVAAGSSVAKKAKSGGSRKGTKAWRKNVDVSEVEAGVQRAREERIQGGILSERPDVQLFSVDVAGDNAIARRERASRDKKPLRSDEILALKSAIPAVNNLRHRTTAVGTGVVHAKKKGALPASELARLKKIAGRMDCARAGQSAGASVKKHKAKSHDLWDAVASEEEEEDFAEGWVKGPQPKKAPTTYGHRPETLTQSGRAMPAVVLADEGQSYNPPQDEWNELVERRAAEESARLRKAGNPKTIRAAQAPDERLEQPVGLLDDESDAADDDADIAEELIASRQVATRAQRKTPAQRNREARIAAQLELEASNRAAKAERRALAAAVELARRGRHGAVSSVVEAVVTEDASVAASSDAGGGVLEEKLRKRKFGKHALPSPALEIQLSDELAESLRTLRPEGNLFKDRFTSLVSRGIVEPRVPYTRKRRYELLKREKYAHKYGSIY